MLDHLTVCLTVETRLEETCKVSQWLHANCKGLSPLVLGSLELATVEAVTNIVRHGWHNEAGHEIELTLTRRQDELEVLICDRGKPIPSDAFVASQCALNFDPKDVSNLPTGGLGLALIHTVADRLSYESVEGVNKLRLFKSL